MNQSRFARAQNAMWGLLVADAAGRPYEFTAPSMIPSGAPMFDLAPPDGFEEAHAGTPAGTWTDDGAQALALAQGLIARGRFDADDLKRNLLAWFERGEFTPDGRVFDVGVQTARALKAIREGLPLAPTSTSHADGNGSLMRVLPLAIWHRGSDRELIRDAREQSHVTHPHARFADDACALFCLVARELINGNGRNAWLDGLHKFRSEYAGAADRILHHMPPTPKGTGFALDSLSFAAHAVIRGWSYEETVRRAISLGMDADTTAAIGGGLVACSAHVGEVPGPWRFALKGEEIAGPIIGALARAAAEV